MLGVTTYMDAEGSLLDPLRMLGECSSGSSSVGSNALALGEVTGGAAYDPPEGCASMSAEVGDGVVEPFPGPFLFGLYPMPPPRTTTLLPVGVWPFGSRDPPGFCPSPGILGGLFGPTITPLTGGLESDEGRSSTGSIPVNAASSGHIANKLKGK